GSIRRCGPEGRKGRDRRGRDTVCRLGYAHPDQADRQIPGQGGRREPRTSETAQAFLRAAGRGAGKDGFPDPREDLTSPRPKMMTASHSPRPTVADAELRLPPPSP